ncbi:hypothetical protein P389DRAFT_170490 [Cystobasidium minutum MCA 4210]|uniref:uncharacterized protein n=1 Tax=Cystobasidium minutum MCA 4210 TaxID=1397322 RepID=UPI0034CF85BA|eukprot:jgi/Rhomi1/170490/fgenesh1_kg.4_\
MQSSLLLVLSASLASLASAAPSPASGSICHVLTYSGACGNLTSLAGPSNSSSSSSSSPTPSTSSSNSCTYSSVCLVPSICNSTALTGSIDALTGQAGLSGTGNDTLPTNATGCVSFSDFGMQMDSLAVCDGNRYLINGTSTAYQCICNDSPDSCPDEGMAVSVSYSNGTSSTSAVPSGQPSPFSWTWGASMPTSSPAPTASSGMNATSSRPAARTTFTFTFGSAAPVNTSGAIAGIGGAQQGNQESQVTGAGARLSSCLMSIALVSLISIAWML